LSVPAAAIAALDKDALRQLGAALNVQQILVADDLGGYVKVADISLDNDNRRSFTVNGGPSAVISELESDWKQTAMNVAANAVEMPISILYDSQSEWLRLKEAINGSAQIQDARLETFLGASE